VLAFRHGTLNALPCGYGKGSIETINGLLLYGQSLDMGISMLEYHEQDNIYVAHIRYTPDVQDALAWIRNER
jgi:hypothetical protein